MQNFYIPDLCYSFTFIMYLDKCGRRLDNNYFLMEGNELTKMLFKLDFDS